MSSKIKNKIKKTDKAMMVSSQLGLLLMSAAATLGMLELPDHGRGPLVINTSRPTFAFGIQNSDQNENTLRRERDESAPHYISYSITQRTPARSGKS